MNNFIKVLQLFNNIYYIKTNFIKIIINYSLISILILLIHLNYIKPNTAKSIYIKIIIMGTNLSLWLTGTHIFI